MKIFLDSADIDDISQALKTGLLDGITTNPSLLSKALKQRNLTIYDLDSYLLDLIKLLNNKEISLEVTKQSLEDIYKEAHHLASLSDNIVIKIPAKYEYLNLINRLVLDGISVNITLIFSFNQAILNAKLNVKYVSLFLGRLSDIGINGFDIIKNVKRSIINYQFNTKVLAASIRDVFQFEQALISNSDVITVPFNVFNKLLDNALTDIGLSIFNNSWKELF